MSKKKICVALLATMAMVPMGCQKENNDDLSGMTTETASAYVVEYSLNGEVHRVTVQTEEEYETLLQRLMAMAREGYEVMVRDGSRTYREGSTKEMVVYTTSDADDATRWTKKMTGDGYTVSVTYDDKTNTYTCIAIR